jgi:hypothetical protein
VTQITPTDPAWSRFDGFDAWRKLNRGQQAQIGALALELIVAQHGIDYASEEATNRWLTSFHVSEILLEDALGDCVVATLGQHFPKLFDEDAQPPSPVPIPSILGHVCRVCLRSEYDPMCDICPESDPCVHGCSWAETDLCTACAGGQS